MNLKELLASLKRFWSEFSREKSGIVGLVLFVLFVLTVAFEPYLLNFRETNRRWHDITYWQDNPGSAPPVWVDLFSSRKHSLSETLENPGLAVDQSGTMRIVTAVFTYQYAADIGPSDFVFHCAATGNVMVALGIERPDGQQVNLGTQQFPGSTQRDVRFSIGATAKGIAINFASRFDSAKVNESSVRAIGVFLAKAAQGMLRNPQALKGTYRITASMILSAPADNVENPRLVVAGSAFGLLGTDNSKRDLWCGLVAGMKWALLIGMLTSLVSVLIGVVYGVVAAYYGGWIDSLMNRVFEFVSSIPVLPLLIVLSAVYKPSIWGLIFIMCVLFWTGSVKTVRSMGLQIKEDAYIEAAHGLGASDRRILFKHMIPQLIPYSFASMALSVPAAIVLEASISLLGLGDPTIVSWGQILRDAVIGGAVLSGTWWWIVPPGLAIALVGMTFAFLGFAMDDILHPKMRTR